MGFLNTSCASTAENTGQQNCTDTPGREDYLWLVPKGTQIATEALVLLEATWDTLFNAAVGTRGYPLPKIFNMTSTQTEDKYEEGWAGIKDFIGEDYDKDDYLLVKSSLYNNAKLRSLNSIQWDAYIVTAKGKIRGYSDDGIIFKPKSILDFRVQKKSRETDVLAERSRISIVWGDPREWNEWDAVVDPTWEPSEIEGIKDIEVVSAVATGTTSVTVTLAGFDGVPHEGAVVGDFVIYDDADAAVVFTLPTPGVSGVYTLVATMAAGDYTVGLIDQPSATTKYFETPTLLSFTTS